MKRLQGVNTLHLSFFNLVTLFPLPSRLHTLLSLSPLWSPTLKLTMYENEFTSLESYTKQSKSQASSRFLLWRISASYREPNSCIYIVLAQCNKQLPHNFYNFHTFINNPFLIFTYYKVFLCALDLYRVNHTKLTCRGRVILWEGFIDERLKEWCLKHRQVVKDSSAKIFITSILFILETFVANLLSFNKHHHGLIQSLSSNFAHSYLARSRCSKNIA